VTKPRLNHLLAYAGALPFLACALLALVGVDSIRFVGAVDHLAAGYALAIVAFLSGVHWGMALNQPPESGSVHLFLSSNGVTIAAWLSFVIAAPRITLGVCILAFLYLLRIDYRLYRLNRLTADYFQTRRNVTAVVVLALALIMATA